MEQDKILAQHSIVLNPKDNGGEGVFIHTKFISNGDPITDEFGVYTTQEIHLASYSNSAILYFSGAAFTPEFLRRWANELEQVRNKLIK